MNQQFLNEFVDGGLGCSRDDCMITSNGPSTTTMAYYPPVYDKNGVNTNPDMNVTTHHQRCISCGKTWIEEWQNGIRISR
jgi:hypothetical protein